MTKEIPNPKHEGQATRRSGFCSAFRASSFLCPFSFVIRHSFVRLIPILVLLAVSGATNAASSNETLDRPLSLEFQSLPVVEKATPPVLHLRGKDARQQLLVTAKFDSGRVRDYTRRVSYSVSPPNVVRIDKAGRVTPLADGTATVTATGDDDLTATLAIAVERFAETKP